jgi:hypothetical protein
VSDATNQWESDAAAVAALERPLYGSGGPPAVDIRCWGPLRDGPCGRRLGAVYDTERGRVLTIGYWPEGQSPNALNRRELTIFLEDAGDWGLYSCRNHGSWPADIDAIRQCADEGVVIGHPRMVHRIAPTGEGRP